MVKATRVLLSVAVGTSRTLASQLLRQDRSLAVSAAFATSTRSTATSLLRQSSIQRSCRAHSTMSSSEPSSNFRVITYNLLSSSLDDAKSHIMCDRDNLNSARRLQRIQSKLAAECAAGSVLCLQEVSLLWVGQLHVWLQQHGYTMVTANYGNRFNGHMGVAIAWPQQTYEAVDVCIDNIADTKRWGWAPRTTSIVTTFSILSTAARSLMKLLPWASTPPPSSQIGGGNAADPWADAQRRHNQMVFVRLRRRAGGGGGGARPVCVATYHMPCAFRVPPMMTIHAALAAQHVARLARGDAHVFAGDFNFTPDSPQYALVTRGALNSSDPAYPVPPPWEAPIDWQPQLAAPLRSAYREVQGREPELTNWSCIGDNGEFSGCLDYVFYGGELSPTEVIPLRDAAALRGQGPFPTAAEPSDHVMLGATFKL
ncbi:Endonuclease/exonuclease/phosphatase [Tribonema minus]|uniref:Endonuclease/exonuclease/phosphatase n=1 Tax=Tribonema minus TaxID=303371 RepID=A0A836CFS4_9STRA|nr:Endonuclease/exonuclease/phosphatase [Tribonema minus]